MSAQVIFTGLFFLAYFVSSGMGQAVEYAPEIGKAHLDFELPSIQDGKPIRFSSYRGKKVLLLHFASW